MILNFSSLVLIFHFLSNLLILSISLSTFYFIINLDLLGVVITSVTSSAYIISKHPYSGVGRSLVKSVYKVGDKTLPCGTPLNNCISLLYSFPNFIFAFLLSRNLNKIFSKISGSPNLVLIFYVLAHYAILYRTLLQHL